MQAEPLILSSSERPAIKAALRGIWGSSFIPKHFDFCVIGTLESIERVIIPDAMPGMTHVDLEAGTAVRFVKLRQADEKPVEIVRRLAA